MKRLTYEYHFGVKVIMKRPTFWEWLTGEKRVASFVLVYELDGPSTIEAMEGAENVLVQGPHDRV